MNPVQLRGRSAATPCSVFAAMLVLAARVAMAQDVVPVTNDAGTLDARSAERGHPPTRPYSPYANMPPLRRPLFGDTHLHTSWSLDAGAAGASVEPDDAYRLARGERVWSSSGQPVRLSRPLDFLVITDHSDNLGLYTAVAGGQPEILADPSGREWHNMIRGAAGARASLLMLDALARGQLPPALQFIPGSTGLRRAWRSELDAAERFNDPGRFTTMVGYEWTASPNGNDLHRGVIFRDGASQAATVEPLTSAAAGGSDDPASLWKWMAAYEQKTGGEVLAIAHGGNRSNGRMFADADASGKKIDKAWAAERARWEPLYEVTETAGDSETHPKLSSDDDFAKFERWDRGNLDLGVAKTDDMLAGEYARPALRRGLEIEKRVGVNPFHFGFAGGTDSHTGLADAEEDNFFGRTAADEPSIHRVRDVYESNDKTGLKTMSWEASAAGYTAVWASENTRAAIFDAMKRRETYATTGPRMTVRFFAGWDFSRLDVDNHDLAALGYRKGIPMGGELAAAPSGKVPTFLVSAEKDPIGANLDRYEIVKGWIDKDGATHERVYDVAVSGDRKIEADGRCRTFVGKSWDLGDATYKNSIGAPQLVAFWSDPAFDPNQGAFYYGRVIEIPTPRWTTYDLARFGIDMAEGTPHTVEERAYTSPVWYAPAVQTDQ